MWGYELRTYPENLKTKALSNVKLLCLKFSRNAQNAKLGKIQKKSLKSNNLKKQISKS